MGPSGPTANVEFEDDRPLLASGKPRPPMPSRGAWVGVSMLAPVPVEEDRDARTAIDPDDVWQPILGLGVLGEGEEEEELTGSLIPLETAEYEGSSSRMH